eukprot:TRINITY_DN13597_c0_g1_i1.p1 TRINITY_DN13597_c0_g1~~TRINITY_DN13597_c0_g1_i1.p1  ORF type:complete len:246 (+),score=31.26 TRINITY_DN13597_c0_g1_i1:32-739(+)
MSDFVETTHAYLNRQYNMLRREWRALPDGMKCIVGGSAGVYCAMKVPALRSRLYTHTHCCWDNTVRRRKWHSVVFAPFTHAGIFHLGFNCYVATSLLPFVQERMKKRRDISTANQAAAYLVAAAVLAQLGGLLISRIPPLNAMPAVGLSGGLYAALVLSTMAHPHQLWQLMLPVEPIEAKTLMTCLLSFDLLCLALTVLTRSPVTGIAHHVHLSGAAVGAASHYMLPQKSSSWFW